MKALIQRVSKGRVLVEGKLIDFLNYPGEYRRKSAEQTRIAFLHDPENLYVLCRAEVAKEGLTASVTNHDGTVYQDDHVGIFIQPDPDQESYYHITVNPQGVLWDARREVRGDGVPSKIVLVTKGGL